LVSKGNDWDIEGHGREKACIAYAVLEGDRLVYEVAGTRFQEAAHS
jgi:hypothetical protein